MVPDFIKKIIKLTFPALVLEDIVLHKHRKTLMKFFAVVAFIFLLLMIFGPNKSVSVYKGAMLLSLALYFLFFCFEAYFYSFYISSHEDVRMVPFEISNILFYSEEEDMTKGFLFSDIGDLTMKRLGISESLIKDFLSKKQIVDFTSVLESNVVPAEIEDYAKIIFKTDTPFADFLFKYGIKIEDFLGAFDWVVSQEREKIEKERWWSKEALLRVPAFGKNWSFGETYTLQKFGRDITDIGSSFMPSYEATHTENLSRLEEILCKQSSSNCIITSDDESSRMDVVTMLAEKIRHNESLLPLIHKRIFVLDTNIIIENSSDKLSFERLLSSILLEAVRAQNVIIVIPYFSSFIKSASTLGSDVSSILSPFFVSPVLHILALDSKSEFHSYLEDKDTIMEHFSVLKIETKSGEGVLSMLKSETLKIEKNNRIFITYTALVAIENSARKYFDVFAFADKSKDLLLEAVPYCLSNGFKILLPEHIFTLISSRTGVPIGVPQGEEKEKLLNLEEVLHKRIIGQEEAVKAISAALRRSRAGVQSPDRPIGSFLFLGPTGVGKTETTKALAEIFFKSTDSMSRIDMSEYKNADALKRLIGSYDTTKPGILSTVIREKPYGVLLLDEFEKTNSDVLNLFLQILDEGVFSDAEGKKVNVRNNIIIATSNAGSELIWEKVKEGVDLANNKDEIINAIIQQEIFKPELLNRFDGVILFHPLGKSELQKIATLMMQKLAKRMLEKGVKIETNDQIIDYLVSKGTDPKFGARPLNRAIQEEIEGLIAGKIIEGAVTQGSTVSFEVEGGSMVKILTS